MRKRGRKIFHARTTKKKEVPKRPSSSERIHFLGEFWVLEEEEKSSSFLHSFFFVNKLVHKHIINKR